MPLDRFMSPDQIERRVESMMNYLDRLWLAGEMSEKSYNQAVRDLDRWAEYQYRLGSNQERRKA